MEKYEKLHSLFEDEKSNDYLGSLVTEYREYRLQALAEKIKSQNLKPKIKLYGY